MLPGVSTVHKFAACIPDAAVGHYITLQISVHGIALPAQFGCLLVKSKSFSASIQKEGGGGGNECSTYAVSV